MKMEWYFSSHSLVFTNERQSSALISRKKKLSLFFPQWKKHWFVLTDQSLRYYKDSIAEEVKFFTQKANDTRRLLQLLLLLLFSWAALFSH